MATAAPPPDGTPPGPEPLPWQPAAVVIGLALLMGAAFAFIALVAVRHWRGTSPAQ